MKRGTVLLAGTVALATGAPAMALDVEGAAQQASAYVSFGFGGSSEGMQSLRYGLQLDQGYRAAGEEFLPPAVKLDFTGAGLTHITLAGLPVARRVMRLSQDEGVPAEGGEEAAAGEESAWYDPTGWGWVGWGIAGAGAVGAYILLSDDDDDASSSSGGGGGGGGDDDGGDDVCLGGPPLCLPGGLPLMGTTASAEAGAALEGLDEGTGFMGDLVAR